MIYAKNYDQAAGARVEALGSTVTISPISEAFGNMNSVIDSALDEFNELAARLAPVTSSGEMAAQSSIGKDRDRPASCEMEQALQANIDSLKMLVDRIRQVRQSVML
jgi:hypothetical protein